MMKAKEYLKSAALARILTALFRRQPACVQCDRSAIVLCNRCEQPCCEKHHTIYDFDDRWKGIAVPDDEWPDWGVLCPQCTWIIEERRTKRIASLEKRAKKYAGRVHEEASRILQETGF